jgi:NAD(P)-dependent dehydrogenase (short-subunit alcohol dehydrogenase family)
MTKSYVVTGGGRGVGRAVVDRLLADGHAVVVIELDAAALAWTGDHPAPQRLVGVVGSAAEASVADRAAAAAAEIGAFAGWVNNAAQFRDAVLHVAPAREVMTLIAANLEPVLAGSAAAVRRWLADGTTGSIVNISSHQAQRPVRGALPYATAKAAIEGLTRALAVDYGPHGIRTNAVALGSIGTERFELLLSESEPMAARRIQSEIRRVHPLGRIGATAEAAAAVAFLLSDESSFVNGAVLPVDGGRAAWGPDPEET